MSEISKYITIIRPEFMAFCKDACRAAALNHLLFRISGKCKDQPREKIQSGEILWYAKTELIASEMSDAWGVCKVRKEVNELVSMGLFGRKSNPTWGVDRTKHFCFGSEQCETLLKYCENNEVCIVHLDLPAEVKHLIYSSLANDRTIKCTCEKADLAEANDKSITCIRYIHPMHSIDLSPAFDKSIEAITKTSTKTSNKDNSKEDTGDTLREQNSTAQNVATATTPARHSQDEPYRPDFSAAQQPNKPASQEKSEQDRVTPAELSTLTGTSPQASAKVEPKQPVQSPSQGKNAKTRDVPPQPSRPAQNSKPQLTLLGGQVRTDYETIRACRLRLTANNIKALNTLGELDGMDFVSLKETIELIEAQNMVKERNIPIDLQALASEDGYWRFDKWYQVVLRNRKQQASKSSPPPPTSASLPSFSDMTDEEFYADARNYSNLRKGNQNVRTAHAR